MTIYKNEHQKTVNLLGDADNESSKFATRKWYVIDAQNNTDFGEGNESGTTVKFETKVIKVFVIIQIHIFLKQEI